MDVMRRIFSRFIGKPPQKGENFLRNGSELQAGLIGISNGEYNIPIRSFTAKELVRATNNFAERVFFKGVAVMFRGNLQGRQILVNKYRDPGCFSTTISPVYHSKCYEAIRDIVVAAHMSHHKNVLRLVGYCLELDCPASVYEYAEGILLNDLLDPLSKNRWLLTWRSRIKIASDIANALLYLHTAFPTPIVYRDLKPSKVIIDQHGVAKLYDFSLSISLPPGELHVLDNVAGTYGFIDPEYLRSNYVTQKSDVYSFGVLLLTLVVNKNAIWENHDGEQFNELEYVQHYADNHQYNQIVDPRILEEEGGVASENLLQSFIDLSLMCIRENGEERPDMIDVAKQLRLMEKASRNHWPSVEFLI